MNLWADFDNNQLTQPVPVSSVRPRRLTEQVILSSLRDWLLHDYVPVYCRALAASRIFRRCYWVDALGGEQKANTSQSLEMLSQLSQESKAIALYGLLLTAGSSKRKELRTDRHNGSALALPSPPPIPKEGGAIRASWLAAAPALLAEIAQSPAIFLLNPCGQTLFSYNDLLPLYQRTLPTELLLWLSHRQLEGHLVEALRSPHHGAALTALLRSDRWKTLATTQEALPQSVNSMIDLLVASMQRHFHLPAQRLQFPLLVRSAVVEVIPYTIVFATRRQDSLLSMNDAVCLYQRRVYEQSHRGLLTEEWFLQQQQEQRDQALQRVYEHLLQQGRAQRIRRWPDLRQHELLSHFGQFTTQDYDRMITRLLASNEVRCEWKRKPIDAGIGEVGKAGNEEVPAVPGNDDTLLWR